MIAFSGIQDKERNNKDKNTSFNNEENISHMERDKGHQRRKQPQQDKTKEKEQPQKKEGKSPPSHSHPPVGLHTRHPHTPHSQDFKPGSCPRLRQKGMGAISFVPAIFFSFP